MQLFELYKFEVTVGGVAEVYRWSAGDDDVNWDGETWTAAKLGRQASRLAQQVRDPKLDIKCAPDNPVALMFRAAPPDREFAVTIYRGERDDIAGTTQAFWVGRVTKVHFGIGEATLKCAPELATLKRRMPVGRYSRACRWALYSDACSAVQGDFTESGEVVDRTEEDRLIVVELTTDLDEAWAVAGSVEIDGERRLVMRQDAGSDNGDGTFNHDIYLDRWIDGLDDGDSVDVLAGCDHTTGDCADKFDNLTNYGGFSYLPDGANPWRGR